MKTAFFLASSDLLIFKINIDIKKLIKYGSNVPTPLRGVMTSELWFDFFLIAEVFLSKFLNIAKGSPKCDSQISKTVSFHFILL